MSYPSFTKTFHNKAYAAISPEREELSCKGKTVIVTGGGSGIGAASALSFAKAGASKFGLIGRTESTLLETKSQIISAYPDAQCCIAIADVSSAESVGRAAHEVRVTLGAWDIFVHSAGKVGNMTQIRGADIDEWWSVFETNTKFVAVFAKHFLTKCRLPGATFIYINAGISHFPESYLPPCASYSASKFAAARLCEWLAKENPDLRVFSVHPGVVDTPLLKGFLAGAGPEGAVIGENLDDVQLPANFNVWLASQEAEFLRGKFVWANWDVEEMIQKKSELEKNPTLLTCQMGGWPFA